MIKLNNIQLAFGDHVVFNDVSFRISEGSNVCIAGPSGRGKSSLLKIMQGLLIPQKGEVVINNEVLTDRTVRSIRSEISWVPQNIDLPVESGFELAELLRLESASKLQIIEFLKILGLGEEFLYRDFKEISGGQKQRVVLAVCIAKKTKILFIDEPTSSLDEGSIHLLINLVQSLKNVTVVSTSHNENWLKSVSQIIQL